jgi:hypothetical protein
MMDMSNTVNFKLDDDLYFKLLALRVRLRAKGGWKGFVERVISDYEKGNLPLEPAGKAESQKDLFAPEQEKERILEKCAVCGHERSEHSPDGKSCYGDGDTCECKGFTVACV